MGVNYRTGFRVFGAALCAQAISNVLRCGQRSPEDTVPQDHPLRPIPCCGELATLSPQFSKLYAKLPLVVLLKQQRSQAARSRHRWPFLGALRATSLQQTAATAELVEVVLRPGPVAESLPDFRYGSTLGHAQLGRNSTHQAVELAYNLDVRGESWDQPCALEVLRSIVIGRCTHRIDSLETDRKAFFEFLVFRVPAPSAS